MLLRPVGYLCVGVKQARLGREFHAMSRGGFSAAPKGTAEVSRGGSLSFFIEASRGYICKR